ncbi:MAG: thioesterase [Oceanicaulis sp.]|uniref:acyl-ACP thioesterase n=1 Tax=unclassified Oceanicaulis TaxID=2632123 RepID=UPI000C6B95CD|nr:MULTISPECIES: acyl-ACP thioesterase [unclassified Oceanicaulis]MBC38124.1 thioesterase [Oceanicaulis sp.]
MQVLWRGNANTWECDELGHLNVRFYMAKAQEALAGLADQLGMHHAFAPDATATLIPRDVTLRFLAEARPGAPLHISGGVIGHDETSLTVAMILFHAASNTPAATFEIRAEHSHALTGRVFGWPQRSLEALDASLIDRPELLTTRSLGMAAPSETLSLSRAQTLGLQEIGRGRINRDELDAFGRMRAEFGIGKVSDSVIHFSDGFPEQWQAFADNTPIRVASAVLESRLSFRRFPTQGEGFVIRSGLKSATETVRTLVHWALDPVSGRPLWSMEAVACMLNLETRRLERVNPDRLAQLQSRTQPELVL